MIGFYDSLLTAAAIKSLDVMVTRLTARDEQADIIILFVGGREIAREKVSWDELNRAKDPVWLLIESVRKMARSIAKR